jgi:hypothetical protein
MFLFNARRGVVITNQVFPTYQVPESVLFVLSLWIDERKLSRATRYREGLLFLDAHPPEISSRTKRLSRSAKHPRGFTKYTYEKSVMYSF